MGNNESSMYTVLLLRRSSQTIITSTVLTISMVTGQTIESKTSVGAQLATITTSDLPETITASPTKKTSKARAPRGDTNTVVQFTSTVVKLSLLVTLQHTKRKSSTRVGIIKVSPLPFKEVTRPRMDG